MDDRTECEEEGRDEEDEEPELDMTEVYSALMILVVDMSEGRQLTDLLELRHSIPYKYKPCGPCFHLTAPGITIR